MTDKEQIMIDGVNVYGCVQFIQEEEDCCNLGGSCKGWPNCYYKQLARKTQECEELKAQLNDMACMDDDNVLCYPRQELKKECDRYLEALEEIENFMNYEFSGQNEWVKTSILDIINKAKGEENVK